MEPAVRLFRILAKCIPYLAVILVSMAHLSCGVLVDEVVDLQPPDTELPSTPPIPPASPGYSITSGSTHGSSAGLTLRGSIGKVEDSDEGSSATLRVRTGRVRALIGGEYE